MQFYTDIFVTFVILKILYVFIFYPILLLAVYTVGWGQ